MRQRWPRPMGASRSTTRPHISSGSVSSFSARVRVDRDELVERGPLPEGARAPGPRRVSMRRTTGRLPSAAKPAIEGAGLEALAVDQLARNQRVLGGRQIVGLRGDEHAGGVLLRREVEDALGRPLGAASAAEIFGPLERRPRAVASGAALPAAPAARRRRRRRRRCGRCCPSPTSGLPPARRSRAERRRTQDFPGSRDLRTWTPKPPAALTLGPGGNELILRRNEDEKRSEQSNDAPGLRPQAHGPASS